MRIANPARNATAAHSVRRSRRAGPGSGMSGIIGPVYELSADNSEKCFRRCYLFNRRWRLSMICVELRTATAAQTINRNGGSHMRSVRTTFRALAMMVALVALPLIGRAGPDAGANAPP